MPQYEGQCHCGQIAWTAEIPEEKHILCHCGACKLMGGGEFTLNQIIPKDNFKLTKGDLKVYTYKGDSGNNTDCYMCPNCASSPYHHQHVMGKFSSLSQHRDKRDHYTQMSSLVLMSLRCIITDTQLGEDKIVIRTGLLKGSEKWGKPAAEIYDKDRASWLPQTGDNSFPTVPPS